MNEPIWKKSLPSMTAAQKERFKAYLPGKVYYTERNISILVALSQIGMIILFLSNKGQTFKSLRSIAYFSLYGFLLIVTCLALVLYRHTFKYKKYAAFVWLRRFYGMFLCIWVIGITFLEQMHGRGLSVYCYLMPTTAALLLLTPIESIVIFGSTWLGLVLMMLVVGKGNGRLFGDTINSIFVVVLTIFISYRYYLSMAKEFCDRETIAQQYEEIEKKNHQLQRVVHIDQLTGLYNRHYLLEKMYWQYGQASMKEHYATLLMTDIDYFKQYNDTYGHVQGDECLRRISTVLRKVCRCEGAVAIRYGGEEFLLIKLSEQPFDGCAFAEKLLREIREENIERSDIEIGRVTVSAGYWYGRPCDTDHIESAIRFADTALYSAKASGRNKLVCYREDMPDKSIG